MENSQIKNKENNEKLESIKITMIGGLGEIGKNMICMEYQDNMIVIDCGIKFPDDDMFGIDLVIPDLTYVIENKEKLRAIFITHGHEDHIGALPYLLSEIKNIDIYGGGLSLELIKARLEEHYLNKKDYNFNRINTREMIDVGKFQIEYIQTNHSISDSYALAINTDLGTIIHSGDFKIDHNPIDGKKI
jgi:ribonuclease J